ncbi:hypothetical protein HMI48_01780 [Acidithiobacillus ferrooxidans]|uniref:hypothetical protein n=1 Tax=Acidithiobacillus ferrooxidans TaxID=920 RepID=UPI001C07B08F|nr:hypothetical protein [Acidithiobacillus ferrooxidans]MBU2772688.1 hypothetical protein [Acidithiobacillus ferrooxidans]
MQMYFNVRVKKSAGIQHLIVEDRSDKFFQSIREMRDEDILIAGSRRARRTKSAAQSDPLIPLAMVWSDPEQRRRLERLLRKGSYSALAGTIFDA